MIFLWSDTHFNHRGILKHCAATRPYASVEEMNEALISAWNHAIKPSAEIYLLGDFGFTIKDKPLLPIFERLQGRKHLVRGNHDYQNKEVLGLPWESQQDIKKLKEDCITAILCHYPMETWEGAHKGNLMLHGHCHGTLKRKIGHRVDMGVDCWPQPVPLYMVAQVAELEPWEPSDHHGDAQPEQGSLL